MIFKPAKQSGVTDDIVRQIEQSIVTHRLKPGDKIQTEREMQNTFQASRGTVREALSVLRQKGLIEIRRGGKGGIFIKKVGIDHVIDGLALLIKYRRVAFGELFEFREAVEELAGSLAVERASSEDIEELQIVLNEMKTHFKKDNVRWNEFYQCERKMHEILARISGNTIIEIILKTIHINLDAYAELVFWDDRGPQDAFNDWCEIVKAIKARQGVRVKSLISSHIVKSNQALEEGARRSGIITKNLREFVLR